MRMEITRESGHTDRSWIPYLLPLAQRRVIIPVRTELFVYSTQDIIPVPVDRENCSIPADRLVDAQEGATCVNSRFSWLTLCF